MKVAAGRCGFWNSTQTLRSRRKLVDGNPPWSTLWGALDKAAATLQKHLAANPSSLDAVNLLQLVQWRCQDTPYYLQATVQLCQFHLEAPDFDAAWKTFEEFNTGGGDKMPAATWLDIRNLESHSSTSNPLSLNMNAWPPPTQRKKSRCLRYCLRRSA